MKLRFKELALAELRKFIWHYAEAFFELYRDSGLWNEEQIIQNYKANAEHLYAAILNGIEKRLQYKRVLGRKIQGKWRELQFYVGERLVIVFYSDSKDFRWIESISIDRKPIIF